MKNASPQTHTLSEIPVLMELSKEDKKCSTMHRTKSYYHGFFKYGAISKSHPCKADVLDVQLKQSNFMASVENISRLYNFVLWIEHLQVKLTMTVSPERAYEMFTSSQALVHSDLAFRKHELAGTHIKLSS